MSLSKIIRDTQAFHERIKALKGVSPNYPEVYCLYTGTICWLSTKVVYVYNGIRFSRHHVESVDIKFDSREKCQKRLEAACEDTIKLGVPCQYDDVIGIV